MVDSYKDKKYLVKYDLNMELLDRFGLKVTDLLPMRNVYMLTTDKGDKILKKIDYSIEEINFISAAIKYIKRKFPFIMDFITTRDGGIYTLWKGEIYCALDSVDGRECQFTSAQDLGLASEALGKFHSASEGFRYNLPSKNKTGGLIKTFSRRLEEMNFFSKIAKMHEHRNEFDSIFLDNVDYNIKNIEDSISILEKSPYYKLCSEEDKIVFCHHELANFNILIKDEDTYFIDFDEGVMDLKIHDICNLINKVEKEFNFEVEKSQSILRHYTKMNTLDSRELEVLYGMLVFPEDFYSIAKDYYTRRKEWDEEVFVEKLKRKTSYTTNRDEFLEHFKKSI
ncbi:MAG TPA: CotS family spore coat protein [Clostridiaceae bacterium]